MQKKVFVDREEEMKILDGYLKEALNGQGKVIFITGETGIGKTTFVEAFRNNILSIYPDVRFASASCYYLVGDLYLGSLTPYEPFKNLLLQLVNQENQRGKKFLSKFLEFLKELGPDWLAAIPAVGSLAKACGLTMKYLAKGRSKEESLIKSLGQVEQSKMLKEMVGTLKNISIQYSPLVLFVDDWQWSDDSSNNLLFQLGRDITESRILFLAALRTHDVKSARDHQGHPALQILNEMLRYGCAKQIKLFPLTRGAVSEFLAHEFYNSCTSTYLQDWLLNVTNGNPLFLTEYIKLLREEGLLTSEGELRRDCNLTKVPESIKGVIEERIRRLNDELRKMLAYASVEGERFTSLVLSHLLKSDRLSLIEKLRSIEQVHELIRTLGTDVFFGEKTTCYAFNHNLVWRMFYENLNEEEREILHSAILELLEKRYRDAEDAQIRPSPVVLAMHAFGAKKYILEARYLLEAAKEAAKSYAHHEVLLNCIIGLSVLKMMGKPGREEKELEIDLLSVKGETELFTGNLQISLMTFEQATKIARELGDKKRLAKAHYMFGLILMKMDRIKESMEHFRESLALSEELDDKAKMANIYLIIAYLRSIDGELDEAFDYCQKALVILENLADKEAISKAYITLAGVHYYREEYNQAQDWLRKALAICEEIGDTQGIATCYTNLGNIYDMLGQEDVALNWYEKASIIHNQLGYEPYYSSLEYKEYKGLLSFFKRQLAFYENQKDKELIGKVSYNIGVTYHILGEYQEALSWYRKSLPIIEEISIKEEKIKTLSNIALACYIVGEYQEALSWYNEIRRMLERCADEDVKGKVYHNIGLVHHVLGEYQEALSWYNKSLDVFEKQNEKERIGKIQNNIGKIQNNIGVAHHTLGNFQEALSWYNKSVLMFEKSGDEELKDKVYYNIGLAHHMLGDHDKALDSYHKSLTIKENLNDKIGMVKTYNNIAQIYKTLKKYDEALYWYKKSCFVLGLIHDIKGLAQIYDEINSIQKILGEQNAIISWYLKSLDISEELVITDQSITHDKLCELMIEITPYENFYTLSYVYSEDEDEL